MTAISRDSASYMRLPIESAHSSKNPNVTPSPTSVDFMASSFKEMVRAEKTACYDRRIGTGTFSITATRIRSAVIPFILASGLGSILCASTGRAMRCTSSGRI